LQIRVVSTKVRVKNKVSKRDASESRAELPSPALIWGGGQGVGKHGTRQRFICRRQTLADGQLNIEY